MDQFASIGAAVGVGIALAVIIPRLVSGQKKKLAGLDALMRQPGGMTLDEIAKALGTNVFAKGYLMQALEQLVAQGTLVKTPPPPGHPRLRIHRDTRYQSAASRA